MNKELAKTLTTALVQFIDEQRPEGSMCCSNTDCENIRAALEEGEYDCVEAFIQKKLSRLTEFEQAVGLVFTDAQLIPRDKDGIANIHDIDEFIKKRAAELLALAKKQLLSYTDESNPAIKAMADLERIYFSNPEKLPKWLKDDIARKELNAHTKGYNNGYKDAEKQYNESVSYHFPIMTQRPFCYEPGGTCTNPQMDCINCPRRNGGWLNTSSGTSTAKLEG